MSDLNENIINIYGGKETLHCLNYISHKLASTATNDDIQDETFIHSLYIISELQKQTINLVMKDTDS